jgi:type 1 glutamine amidotransferase
MRSGIAVAALSSAVFIGTFVTTTAQQPAPAQPAAAQQPQCGGRSSNPRVACPGDVEKMMAALPAKAPAKPQKPRKILVLAAARGWVHSSIPLAARMMEEMGKKTGAWSATTTYEASDVTAENLKQYDAIFLDSTTGMFLDDPNDAAATAARRKALMEFVRGGKGLVGLHAASDSYHGDPAGRGGPGSPNAALWPEFNKMIGGWFKFHWNDPQLIVVKLDDPKSPINAPFNGQPFEIRDETYTFPMDSWSRENVHVLTSVDYSKMSDEDKAKEGGGKRTDGDYGLCWIRREGKGRMFYEAHGHSERVYAMTPMLEHLLAGVQYALGDLKADDAPSAKPGSR